jgi:hypothetical protein
VSWQADIESDARALAERYEPAFYEAADLLHRLGAGDKRDLADAEAQFGLYKSINERYKMGWTLAKSGIGRSAPLMASKGLAEMGQATGHMEALATNLRGRVDAMGEQPAGDRPTGSHGSPGGSGGGGGGVGAGPVVVAEEESLWERYWWLLLLAAVVVAYLIWR